MDTNKATLLGLTQLNKIQPIDRTDRADDTDFFDFFCDCVVSVDKYPVSVLQMRNF